MLIERPALQFEIEGRADPEQDGEGIQRARLERRLRALKRQDMGGRDEGESVEISQEDYPGLLARVYREEDLPAERLPVEEMERRLLAVMRVDGD